MNLFTSYTYLDAVAYKGNHHAGYLRRAWPRLEMLAGACLPVLGIGPKETRERNRRLYKFKGLLQFAVRHLTEGYYSTVFILPTLFCFRPLEAVSF